jgi:UDP-N-acetylmuramoyl-tripeptide--D-alanyl-D-alanine ligase
MIPLPLREVAEITAGRVRDADPELVVSGPAFLDSRTPQPAGLFVAFAGERVDGHEFARDAVEAGAAAVLGTRPTGLPSVLVDDTEAALQRLAQVVLSRLRGPGSDLTVLAVTGSSGKTSVKDMLAAVLGRVAPTVATAGSFNNELGLPLTVLRATGETRHLVLEMGARGVGHLASLCALAPPDVSLVLNVGKAHLGEFGSQHNIAVAKGELVEALGPDGVAVLNADDPLVSAMASRTRGRVTTFGHAAVADVRLSDVGLDELGRPSFQLSAGGSVEAVSLHLVGEHQAVNAAAVAAAALAAGLRLDEACAGLRSVERLSRWRMEIRERPDGLVVVNDAYNANPDSMRAALETLARMGGRAGRRTVAVLGTMRELGDSSADEHRAVGRLAGRLGIDVVVVVGDDARATYDALVDAGGAPVTTRHVGTRDEAAAWLRDNVAGPDVVLVKASRSEGLELLADEILGEEATA